MPVVNHIEPLSPPDLVAGVAECLDNYVLQMQTQEQVYEAIRAVMQEFHAKNQAYRMALNRQSPAPLGRDAQGFADFMAQMLKKRLDYAKEDEDKGKA